MSPIPAPTPRRAHLRPTRRPTCASYQADWLPWIGELKAGWTKHDDVDLMPTLQAWWEPLLAMAPTLRAAVGAACLLRARRRRRADRLPGRRGPVVRRRAVRLPLRHRPRDSVETVVAERAVDWSNSLFLSCRFRAWREASSTSGSTTSSSRCRSSGCGAPRPRPSAASTHRRETEPDIELGDFVVQRRCPHRNADLAVFGELDGCVADVHAARLALRPRDRPLPHRRRPPDPGSSPLGGPCATSPPTRSIRSLTPCGRAARSPEGQTWRMPWTHTGMPIGIMPVSQM